MDRQNLQNLKSLQEQAERKRGNTGTNGSSAEWKCHVGLFGQYGKNHETAPFDGEEVVDPYYGGDDGFETVFEQMQRFSKAFLEEVVENLPNAKLRM